MKRVIIFALAFAPLLFFAQAYNYTLTWANPAEHTYNISLITASSSNGYTDFELPAWRPGRYFLQDYAAAVSGFQAKFQDGTPLTVTKTASNTWRVKHPKPGTITVYYNYYANYMDAGSSMLDRNQAYFNPVNLFMHIAGEYERPCSLEVSYLPKTWKAATALTKSSSDHKLFTATSYHDFVDSPTILSPTLKTLHSRIDGVDFYFHFQGKFPDDKATEDAFQTNLGKIIREQWAMMGDMPMSEYHFIYQLLPYNIGHAVEHKYSAMFALPDRMTSSPEAIKRANGISAHEFFHLWNVKRIRPAALLPYDYQHEQYTSLHWFTEGVTEYYTQLTLLRAGLIDRDGFFRTLAGNITSLENSYANTVISPAQSSTDSWLARSQYAPSYHRISYYTQGMRLGLLLDVHLRTQTNGKHSLDGFFRHLYTTFHKKGKGIGEEDLPKELKALTGVDFTAFFRDHVFGTAPIDYDAFLEPIGLKLGQEVKVDATWHHIGITRTSKTKEGMLKIKEVLPNSDAAMGELEAGMVVEFVNGKPVADFDVEAFFYSYKSQKKLTFQVRSKGDVKDCEVEWTNKYAPKDYFLQEDRRAKKKSRKLLEAWLASNVGK